MKEIEHLSIYLANMCSHTVGSLCILMLFSLAIQKLFIFNSKISRLNYSWKNGCVIITLIGVIRRSRNVLLYEVTEGPGLMEVSPSGPSAAEERERL